VKEISGEIGDFHVKLIQHPRYVDVEKCIACGACAEKCPKKVPNQYDCSLASRKAIYVKYSQAVPLKYAIDPEHCIRLTKGKCGNCQKICPAGAIRYDDKENQLDLRVGAVILAEGGETYDPGLHDIYGYRGNPDVVTSLEFERILSASGPYGGHMVRPSDKKEPKRIAWLQCVGSRDVHLGARGYCSAVCCTYAVKEAMLAKEHAKDGLDAAIFYMDMRTHGKDFERYYNRAKDDLGVRFIKSRIDRIVRDPETGANIISYVDDKGIRQNEAFDMIVLSVGLATSGTSTELARRVNLELDHYGYHRTKSFSPVESSRPGIIVCGACQAPKDIPSSVIDSSAAAGVVGGLLNEARWSETVAKASPKSRDIRGEEVRIGVFVCRCGTNIAGVVDVPKVVEFAKTLPGVAHAEENMFSCSQDTQEKMAKVLSEKNLNRVVVAACTPKTHEPLFQETLMNAGLNKYLFEMANIRNQCSWVHKDNPKAATLKAMDLVAMAVAKAAMLEPLDEPILNIKQSALVVGGGVAGMEAARNLSRQGYKTFLVEREERLGGNALRLYKTWRGEEIKNYLEALIKAVEEDDNIRVFTGAEVAEVEGFVGNFKTIVKQGRDSRMVEHGVTIIATGASELPAQAGGLPQNERILTGLQFQSRLAEGGAIATAYNTFTFLQCYGSRIPERPYCSKVCCTQSINSALEIKRRNPQAAVYVIYRDMRPYGLREDLYREARERGVVFIRYEKEDELKIFQRGEKLSLRFKDCALRQELEVKTDVLVLAAAITPEKENPLAKLFKVPQNEDGFFVEAHVKLRPVDFATDGVFVCGLAHSPKPLDESIAQAQAAAARAVTLLSKKSIAVSGTVARVNPALCSVCGVCVSICPYSAPKFDEKTGKAVIQSTLCKGCGLCASSCRSGAIGLKGFDTSQIMAMIEMS
jgi:heterodisulfide reductase subunit A